MKIERVFNENSNILFRDILQSLVDDNIDSLIEEYYHQDKVNTATSLEQEDVA